MTEETNQTKPEEVKRKKANIKELLESAPPLFLPNGSVRSILAIGLLVLVGNMLLGNHEIPDWLISTLSAVMGFYFGSRQQSGK